MAQYHKVELEAFFSVTHLVEILYRGLPKEKVIDYKKNYDFWCFYYVDRGHVVFHMEDGESVVIGSGQGVFFAPFHSFAYSPFFLNASIDFCVNGGDFHCL